LSTRKQIYAAVFSRPCDSFLWGYVNEQVFVPLLPLDIDELKLKITAAIERVDRYMLEMSWIRDWTLIESRMERTLNTFRACQVFRVCHSSGTSYSCIAVMITSV
jgi:hypothetical protein